MMTAAKPGSPGGAGVLRCWASLARFEKGANPSTPKAPFAAARRKNSEIFSDEGAQKGALFSRRRSLR